MKKYPILLLLVVQGVLAVLLFLQAFGSASAAQQLLSFLTPEAQAIVLSSTTLISAFVIAYGLTVWVALRDFGWGRAALKSMEGFKSTAKESNDRAWAAQAEYAAHRGHVDQALAEILETVRRIEAQHGEFAKVVSETDKKLIAVLEQKAVDWDPAFQKIKEDMVKIVDQTFRTHVDMFRGEVTSARRQARMGFPEGSGG